MSATLLLLPALSLHPPRLADPREWQSRLAIAPAGIDAAMADTFGFVGMDGLTLGGQPLAWQLGLGAGVYMGFLPGGELTFDLVSFDGIFGLPLDLRWGRFDARLSLTHLSAHYADGVRRIDGPLPEDTGPYSREWAELNLGVQLGPAHPYVSGRIITHSADGGAGPAVGLGVDAALPRRVSPVGGVWYGARQEQGWTPAFSAQLGLGLRADDARDDVAPAMLRLMADAYVGPNQAGKLEDRDERRVGFLLGFSRVRSG